MKKLFTIAIAMFLLSCTSPELETYTQTEPEFCGKIIALGEDQRGDYIIAVSSGDRARFKVNDYQAYKINTTTCDLAQLEIQPE